MESILHINRMDVFDNIDYLIKSFEKTPEGYLKGRAVATNTGIFNYKTKDGKTLRELRTPEEVFNSKTLDSLKNKPLTNNHPKELVNSENAKKYTIGFTGSDVQNDGHAVSIDLVITDAEAIKQIETDGKRALSCGYEADLEMKSGNAFGNNQYDAIQRNINYNHVALVDVGRAGDLAKIKLSYMDSCDAILENKTLQEETMKSIKIDGIEYQADEKVLETYHNISKDHVTLNSVIVDKTKELSKLQGTLDVTTAELEKTKKELVENKMTDADINKLVNEKLSIIKIADSLKIELVKDGKELTNSEIKRAVIMKKNSALKLEDKDDVYVDSVYDFVVKMIDEEIKQAPANKNKQDAFADNIPKDKTIPEGKVVKSKREKYDEYCSKLESQHLEYKGSAHVE